MTDPAGEHFCFSKLLSPFGVAVTALLWSTHACSASAQSIEDLVKQRDAAIEAMLPRMDRWIVTIDDTKKEQLLSEAVPLAVAYGMNIQFGPGDRGEQKLTLRGSKYFVEIDSPSSDGESVISLVGTGEGFAIGKEFVESFLKGIKRAGISKKVRREKARK